MPTGEGPAPLGRPTHGRRQRRRGHPSELYGIDASVMVQRARRPAAKKVTLRAQQKTIAPVQCRSGRAVAKLHHIYSLWGSQVSHEACWLCFDRHMRIAIQMMVKGGGGQGRTIPGQQTG